MPPPPPPPPPPALVNEANQAVLLLYFLFKFICLVLFRFPLVVGAAVAVVSFFLSLRWWRKCFLWGPEEITTVLTHAPPPTMIYVIGPSTQSIPTSDGHYYLLLLTTTTTSSSSSSSSSLSSIIYAVKMHQTHQSSIKADWS